MSQEETFDQLRYRFAKSPTTEQKNRIMWAYLTDKVDIEQFTQLMEEYIAQGEAQYESIIRIL